MSLKNNLIAILTAATLGLAGCHKKDERVSLEQEVQSNYSPFKKACNLEAVQLGLANNPQEVRSFSRSKECKKIPLSYRPNFGKALNAMWDFKVGYSGNKLPVRQAKDKLLESYKKNPNKTTLDNYINLTDQVARETFNGLDWNKVARGYHLSPVKVNILKKALKQIGGKELIAYAMTELLPSRSGQRNKKIFSYLLNEAGAKYLESFPALFDQLSSFGPYQFTSLAIYDVPGSGKIGGASMMNRYLRRDLQIPGSVNQLEGSQAHQRAACLLADHNVSYLIKQLNQNQLRTFNQYLDNPDSSLVQYIATAHNLPTTARRSAKRWLDHGAKSDFFISCDQKGRSYALKTKANYEELKKNR